jgi:ABC-type molybdate transport system substrate-binding protein
MRNSLLNISTLAAAAVLTTAILANAQNVVYKPYIQPGDAGTFGAKDQMVIAWQTDEKTPSNTAYTWIMHTRADDQRLI